jgi:hypothetical protein
MSTGLATREGAGAGIYTECHVAEGRRADVR